MTFSKITIIGSGNVAFHLARQMRRMKLPLVEIAGRPSSNLNELGKKCKVDLQTDFSKIKNHTGLYLLVVSDDAIAQVAKSLPIQVLLHGNVVHTSGATASKVLKNSCAHYGVFWPLQTFSKSRKVRFTQLPFLITSSAPVLQKKLSTLAKSLGGISLVVSDLDRLRYHCAAVLVNNFTNQLFAEAQALLAKKKLPFEVFHPLMMETMKKAIEIGPEAAQTGPAKRGDELTMERHLDLLQDPKLAALYRLISERIAKAKS